MPSFEHSPILPFNHSMSPHPARRGTRARREGASAGADRELSGAQPDVFRSLAHDTGPLLGFPCLFPVVSMPVSRSVDAGFCERRSLASTHSTKVSAAPDAFPDGSHPSAKEFRAIGDIPKSTRAHPRFEDGLVCDESVSASPSPSSRSPCGRCRCPDRARASAGNSRAHASHRPRPDTPRRASRTCCPMSGMPSC